MPGFHCLRTGVQLPSPPPYLNDSLIRYLEALRNQGFYFEVKIYVEMMENKFKIDQKKIHSSIDDITH
jgi:hypothetical protein